jgi:hypothetical protein
MKNQSRSRLSLIVITIVFLLFCGNVLTFPQSDATRRLSVAVNGFELNEPAAKDALAAGADINWQNDAMDGETMLITAIKGYKEAKIIKFLLDNGADASIKDETGKTALEWARQRNIGRDRNGREIIAMLEAATGQKTNPTKTGDTTSGDKSQIPNKPTNPAANIKQKRTGGAPSDDEIKATMEKSFTNIYESHFFGVKNKVTFEWVGGITVGAIQTIKAAPKSCYPVKLQVSVTAEDPRDGNRSTVVRGMNATTGNYKEEIFCFYRDGFDEWDYGTYGK